MQYAGRGFYSSVLGDSGMNNPAPITLGPPPLTKEILEDLVNRAREDDHLVCIERHGDGYLMLYMNETVYGRLKNDTSC